MTGTIGHIAPPFAREQSSINTVIARLSEGLLVHGFRSVVATSSTRSFPSGTVVSVPVRHDLVCPREYWTNTQRRSDIVLGLLGANRRHSPALFAASAAALKPLLPEVVLVHEGHLATTGLENVRRILPSSLLILYLHTPISRSIRPRELRRLIRSVDGVIAVGRAPLIDLSWRLGQMDVASTVVGNGVDTALFRPQQGLHSDPGTVLFVGQISPQKGVDRLIRAFGLLSRELPDSHLRIIGSSAHGVTNGCSPYETDLRRLAGSLGVAPEFVGYVPHQELPAEYSRATVSCFPSVWAEPFGMVALESVACGCPAVVSDRGGLADAAGRGCIAVNQTMFPSSPKS